MLHSMTAFARGDQDTEWGALTWEMRSVNHRFLEVSTRLPDDLRSLEPVVREKLAAKLGRGKVECNLRFRPSPTMPIEVVVNKELVRRLVSACREVEGMMGRPAQIDSHVKALDILRWPGVSQIVEINLEPLHQAALALLDDTVNDLIQARAREGARLKDVIEQRGIALEGWLAQVRVRLPEVKSRWKERLLNRIAEAKVDLEASRFEQELVVLAQKMDVDEELERLSGHIQEIQRTLNQKEPVGRRLDFLMQELNREANTLGSKSVDIETTRASVEMKVLIEQMREQIQNIE